MAKASVLTSSLLNEAPVSGSFAFMMPPSRSLPGCSLRIRYWTHSSHLFFNIFRLLIRFRILGIGLQEIKTLDTACRGSCPIAQLSRIWSWMAVISGGSVLFWAPNDLANAISPKPSSIQELKNSFRKKRKQQQKIINVPESLTFRSNTPWFNAMDSNLCRKMPS